MAEDLAKTGGGGNIEPRVGGASEIVQVETLKLDIQHTIQRLEMLKMEKAKIESEASTY